VEVRMLLKSFNNKSDFKNNVAFVSTHGLTWHCGAAYGVKPMGASDTQRA